MTRPRHVVARILDKCIGDTPDECWIFTGSLLPSGYGRIHFGARNEVRLAHRVLYEQIDGPVPTGLDLDHLCRNRACVNPWHLEPVTRSENLLRAQGMGDYQRRKTHCPQGHAYNLANTYVNPSGRRSCRRCGSAEGRRLSADRRAL